MSYNIYIILKGKTFFMKKKTSYKSEKIMIIVAVALLAVAAVCIIYLAINATGAFDNIGKTEITTTPETTLPIAVIEHDDIETETNSDGTPHKVVYYKDNVYDGSIDYVYDGNTIYEFYFNADNEYYKSVKKQINELGNIIYESYSSASKKLNEIEYTYYDDNETLWKKQTTNHEDEIRVSVKELYSEDGLLTDKYVYEDSVEVSHVVYTYDENGEIVNEEEVLG